MPNARRTSYDNYNVQTRVDSRSTKSTYIVTDRPKEHTAQTVTTEEGRKWAKTQDDYIRGQEMILLDGVIGNDPAFLTPARLIIEARNANIAGMQRHLYYRPNGRQPEVTMIYTPNLTAPGYPNDRAMFVDLEAGITRVFNSDYFGIEEGWPAHVEQEGLRRRRACPPRRVQGYSGREGATGLLDRRPERDREDDDDLHHPEQIEAGSGRFRRAHAGRQDLRHRERLLRQDLQPRPEARTHHLWCGDQA